jgi:predicted PurR-regulated permease PerM
MKQYPFYVKAVYLLLLAFLFFYGLVYAKFILVPFILGCLIAALLTPIATRFEKWGAHRTLSSFLCIIILALIIGGLIFLLSRQILGFISDLPTLTNRVNERLNDIQTYIERKTHFSQTRQISWLQNQIATGGSTFAGALSATTSTFATVALIPLYTFFLLFYRNKIQMFFEKITPEQEHYTVHQIIHRVKEMVQSYLSGIIIVIFIISVMVTVGLEIIGVPYAIFLGVLAGFLNVIPYLGIFTAASASVVMATIATNSPNAPLWTFFLFLGTHILEANIITPNILGSKVSINPLASLLALVIGEEVWGIVGMILFIPLSGVIKVVFDNIKAFEPYAFLMGAEPQDGQSISWHGTWRKTKRLFLRSFKK